MSPSHITPVAVLAAAASAAILLFAAPAVSAATAHRLPRYFKLCERNDPNFGNCVANSVNNLRPHLEKGIRSFKIPPLNPLLLDEVRLNEGSGPVSINLKLMKLTVLGGEMYKVTNVRNELENYKLHFKLDLPILQLLGNYEMEGRALLLPIRGKGKANITVYDISPEATLIGKPEIRDGKLYMDLEDFPVTIGPARSLSLHFDNLFGGNKQLGDTMNQFLNDNWRELMNELRPIIEDVVSAFLISASRNIFHTVPFDSLFPEHIEESVSPVSE